jgi:hypothetical protein
MTGHLDRPEMVRAVLKAQLEPAERRVMCACICLASDEGLVELDITLLSPMAGFRFASARTALKLLEITGWLVPVGERWRVCDPSQVSRK